MHGASSVRIQLIALLIAWALVFAASFIVPPFIRPTGELYTYGLNRVVYWFWLQVAALVPAIGVWVLAWLWRRDISRGLVWLSRVPLLVAAAEVLGILAIIQQTMFRL